MNGFEQVFAESRGNKIEREFIEQMDAYYASPSASFHDNTISRKFYQQKLAYLKWAPYPQDGAITFGASGTNQCDRQVVYKYGGVKVEKTPDIPFRGRQRRTGSAVVDFFQLDLLHMEKRLGPNVKFKMSVKENGEFNFEDAAQVRKVFEYDGVKFAITAKPDGILDYEGSQLLFEYKTKASGIVAMNNKLNFKGAQDDHLRQVTAESLVFGIREGLIVYESTEKPSWFSDYENKNVPKTRKTWTEDKPVSDLRAFYFNITDEMQQALLADLAKQAKQVYSKEVPEMKVEMTGRCGFCAFSNYCKSSLSDSEKQSLIEAEERYAKSNYAGKYEHRNLLNYLDGVGVDG